MMFMIHDLIILFIVSQGFKSSIPSTIGASVVGLPAVGFPPLLSAQPLSVPPPVPRADVGAGATVRIMH